MAVQPVHFVVASNIMINPSETPDIPQGSIVGLDPTDGYCVLAADTDTITPIGIAADSRSSGVTSYTLGSGSALSRNPKTSLTGALIAGAFDGQSRFTQVRVPDNYNEVFAAGKMSVYHSGGEFWTDQYETIDASGNACEFNWGDLLYTSPAQAAQVDGDTTDVASNGGKFTCTDPGGAHSLLCGIVLTPPTAYPSGVPGVPTSTTDTTAVDWGWDPQLPEGANSLAWGTLLHVKLTL